ncbi:MAG: tetratricopeptide repeat protein [Bacteroidetes bacterium]|nr:tetratricopeptide repeat protein [Bacteroidota bacterium]
MKYISILTLLFIASTVALPAQTADERNTLRLAQSYEQAGKYEDALRFYQDLYRQNPLNSAYFDGVRRSLTALKRYDAAIALLSDRMRRQTGEVLLWVYRGGIYLQQEKHDSAEADWDDAITMNPRNGQVYSQIADQCINAREYDRGIAYLRRGREALQSPQMFAFEIARASAMNMDFDTAMDEYLGYLRAVPQALYQIQQQLSLFSEIPAAMDAAVNRAQVQIDNHPDSEPLRYLLAWLYMERKDYDAAYGVYRALDRMKNAGGMEIIKFASRAFNDKEYRVAARAYREVADEHPDAGYLPQAEFFHARSLEELYAREGMPEELSGGGTRFPSTESVSSYQGAIRLYEEVAEKFAGQPVASESMYRIGYIKFHRFADTDGALDILNRISESRRTVFGKADADILIGDILLARGDIAGAIRQYDAVLPSQQLEEDQRRALRFKIAEAFFFRGDFDTVLVQLAPLMEDVGTDIANDALDLSALIQQYRAPGELPLQKYAQALFLERQKKNSEAAAVTGDIISEFASTDLVDLAYLKQAELQLRMGKPGQAASTLTAFLEQRNESFLRDRGLFRLARLQEESLNNREAATGLYQQLLTEHPHSPLAPQARERIVELRKGNS